MTADEALTRLARDLQSALIQTTSTGHRWTLPTERLAWVEGADARLNRGYLKRVHGDDLTDIYAHPLVGGVDVGDPVLLPSGAAYANAVLAAGLTDPAAILETTGFGDPAYAAYCKAAGVALRSVWREGFEAGIAPQYLDVLL